MTKRPPSGRRQFLRADWRAGADGTATVTPVGGAGSHLVKALAWANALIVVPEETTGIAADTVSAVATAGVSEISVRASGSTTCRVC